MVTRFDERFLPVFEESLESLSSAAEHLFHTHESLKHLFPLSDEKLEKLDEGTLERIDALTVRFARYQDMLGSVFKSLALLEAESPERFIDLLNLMEKRGILKSTEQWFEERDIRNAVAHGYIFNLSEKVDFFNAVAERTPAVLAYLQRIQEYARSRLGLSSPGPSPEPG